MTTGSVNYANRNIDQTVRVFDEFFRFEANVPANEYDVVNSFFIKEMADRQVAANFTASLFQVAENTGIPAVELLQAFQGQIGLDLTASLAYYLNQIRSRATLLGVGVALQPNFYAARNVVQ
jgi:predicted ATP-grasp superfamily ATP-dependent carboligase